MKDPNWKGNFDIEGGQVREDGTPVSGGGPTVREVRFITVSGPLNLDDNILVATPAGAEAEDAIHIQLPDVVAATGREYIIAHGGAVGEVALHPVVGQFINYDSIEEGVSTHNTRHLYSIGTTWLLLS